MTLFIENRDSYVKGTLGDYFFRIEAGCYEKVNFTLFYFSRVDEAAFSHDKTCYFYGGPESDPKIKRKDIASKTKVETREKQSELLIKFLERVVPKTDESTALVNLMMNEANAAKGDRGMGYFDTGPFMWSRTTEVSPVIERV